MLVISSHERHHENKDCSGERTQKHGNAAAARENSKDSRCLMSVVSVCGTSNLGFTFHHPFSDIFVQLVLSDRVCKYFLLFSYGVHGLNVLGESSGSFRCSAHNRPIAPTVTPVQPGGENAFPTFGPEFLPFLCGELWDCLPNFWISFPQLNINMFAWSHVFDIVCVHCYSLKQLCFGDHHEAGKQEAKSSYISAILVTSSNESFLTSPVELQNSKVKD